MREYMAKRRHLRRKEKGGLWKCEACGEWLTPEAFPKKGKGYEFTCCDCVGYTVRKPRRQVKDGLWKCETCSKWLSVESFPKRGRGKSYVCSDCLMSSEERKERRKYEEQQELADFLKNA